MPEEDVINNGKTRKGEERVQKILVIGGLGRKRQLQVIRTRSNGFLMRKFIIYVASRRSSRSQADNAVFARRRSKSKPELLKSKLKLLDF
ncbi:hypothetical protein TNCV_409441 [Trichonephila clavipes]|nr:hypothetical protein TNCV_409441 [Trichonephila clavipes]